VNEVAVGTDDLEAGVVDELDADELEAGELDAELGDGPAPALSEPPPDDEHPARAMTTSAAARRTVI
jgi:hypothetical protein